jgi:PAS domain S-box-containing protein
LADLRDLLRRHGRPPVEATSDAGPVTFADQLLQQLDIGVMVFSAANRLLYSNDAAAAILDRDLDPINQSAVAHWITLREDGTPMPVVETPLGRALTQGVASHGVILADVAPSGTRRWLEVSACPLPLLPGMPPAALLTFGDITSRRQGELALKDRCADLEALAAVRSDEVEQTWRNFVEFVLAAPMPMCVFARDGTLGGANPRFWDTFGYTPGQILGLEDWWERAYPDPVQRREIARHWLDLQNRQSAGTQAQAIEQEVTCSDGRTKVMEVGVVALREGYVVTFVDVSERRASAGRLQQAVDLNLRLIDASTQGMVLYQADGRCVVANDAATRLLGMGRAILLAQDFRALPGWSANGLAACVDQVLADGLAQHIECEFGQPGEQQTCLAVDVVGVAGHAGQQVLLMFDDITHFRAEAVRLREDKRMAEDANRSKSAFLANMSHEIRNPLNAIMGVAEVLRDDRLDSDQRGLVDTISAAGRGLLEIVNDILDFARIEAGRLEVELKEFDLAAVLAHKLQLWTASAEQKGLLLALDSTASVPSRLIGDAARLGQILSNLISNAIKFTDHGNIHIAVDCVMATARSLTLRFRVRDTGRGIPVDKQTLIFEPFIQLDPAPGARGMGTGLGLAISRELAVLLGGTVGFESRPGLGSEFWVQLPFRRAEPISDSRPTAPIGALQPSPDLGSGLAGIGVLVVDDNPVNLEVAARLLEREGADVSRAAGGREALQRLENSPRPPQVILLDVQMPGMDGLEVCRRIRRLPGGHGVRILALSAGALPHQRAQASQAGMDDFIAKPFEQREMLAMVRRVLAIQRVPLVEATASANDATALLAEVPEAKTTSDTADPAELADLVEPANSANLDIPSPAENATDPTIAESFPNVPGHNRKIAWRRMQGDRELYLRSLRLFDVELVRIGRELRRHLDQVNAFLLGRHLHRLKGAGAMVGAVQLAAAAEDLEGAVAELVSLQALQGTRVAQLSPTLRNGLQSLLRACDTHRADLAQSLRALRLQQTLPGKPAGQPAGPRPMLAERGAVHTLIGLLQRHDLAALDLYRDLERPLGSWLSARQQREMRLALDVLAFGRAVVILREMLVEAPSDRSNPSG